MGPIAAGAMEPELAALLRSVGLERYVPRFEEEAITELSLLASMGADGLVDAMDELGMDARASAALRDALFPSDRADSADELTLEENEEDDELVIEENDEAVTGVSAPEPAAGQKKGSIKRGFFTRSSSLGSSEQAERHKRDGNAALEAGKYALAAERYSRAIEIDPSCAVYFSNRAHARVCMRDFAAALVDADRAVALRPEWPKGYVRRGAAHMGLGQHAEAEKEYARAIELEPTSSQLHSLLAEARDAAGDAAGADGGGMSNWVAVLNEEVRHRPYFDQAQDDETEAMAAYLHAVQSALAELREATSVEMRTGVRGARVEVRLSP